jgi:hypothetical protein
MTGLRADAAEVSVFGATRSPRPRESPRPIAPRRQNPRSSFGTCESSAPPLLALATQRRIVPRLGSLCLPVSGPSGASESGRLASGAFCAVLVGWNRYSETTTRTALSDGRGSWAAVVTLVGRRWPSASTALRTIPPCASVICWPRTSRASDPRSAATRACLRRSRSIIGARPGGVAGEGRTRNARAHLRCRFPSVPTLRMPRFTHGNGSGALRAPRADSAPVRARGNGLRVPF